VQQNVVMPLPTTPVQSSPVMPSSFVQVKKIAPKEQSLKSAGIDAEYELILEALKKVNFNKSKAAKVLQIDRKTLYNKIRQYQELRGEKFESEI
jgi:two-component system response regulator HydG